MTKKKVELSYISNDSKRKSTFKKRRRSLMKKAHELSTLCGVDVCAIVYSPFDINSEVWPSNSGAQRVISKFKALPEINQQTKMVDQVSFTMQRISKAFEHMKRERKEGQEMETTELMFQSLVGNMRMFRMNIIDLYNLGYMIDQYIKDLNYRKEILLSPGMEICESSKIVATSFEEIGPMENVATSYALTTTITEPSSLYPGLYEQSQVQNLNLNHNQPQQQMFMEVNHLEQMSFPFINDSQIHHQQIPTHFSSTSAASSSHDIPPVAGSNSFDHILFP